MRPCPRKEKLAKYGFIYPQAAHGPFGHICATSHQADVFVYKTCVRVRPANFATIWSIQMRKWCHLQTP